SNLPRSTIRAAAFSLSAEEPIRTSSMSCSGSNPVIATTFNHSALSFCAPVPASLNAADSTIGDTRRPNTTLLFEGRKSSAESPAAANRAAARATRTNLIRHLHPRPPPPPPHLNPPPAASPIHQKVISPPPPPSARHPA